MTTVTQQDVARSIQVAIRLAVEAGLMDCAVKLVDALEDAGGRDPAGPPLPAALRRHMKG